MMVVTMVLLVMLERRGHDIIVAGAVVVVVVRGGEVAGKSCEGLMMVRGVRKGGDVWPGWGCGGCLVVVALRG